MKRDVKPRRRYNSQRRQEQARATRQAILDAAHQLFVSRGYIATSVREVAADAGVAEATVYAAFKDKPSILWALVERMMSGEEAVPLSQSEVVRSIKAEPDLQGRLRKAVRWGLDTFERGIGALEDAVRQAAEVDPHHEVLLREGNRRQQEIGQLMIGLLLEVAPHRPNVSAQDLLDLIDAIFSPPVYRMLVEERGWPIDKYEHWMFRIIENLFVADTNG